MGQTLSEIKAKLLADYAALLDDVLEEGAAAKTLTSIEELALQTRAKVGTQVTRALLENRGEQVLPNPVCSTCGQVMRYKGPKQRYLRTRSGDVEVERAYYYCPACRVGLFPPR